MVVVKKDICMTAKKRLERKISYPIFMQTKLDGLRGVFCREKKKFYTRKGLLVEGLPSLTKELSQFNFVYNLDGEFLAEGMTFNEVNGIVRRKSANISPLESKITFYCFDIISNEVYSARRNYIQNVLSKATTEAKHLFYLSAVLVKDKKEEEEIHKLHSKITEGSIYRTPEGLYQIGKCSQLLKRKDFKYLEVFITGLVEGKGRLKGSLGAFAVTFGDSMSFQNKNKFTVGSGLTDSLRELYWRASRQGQKFKNRKIIIKYQELSEYGIPRFPIFKEFVI